MAELTKKKRVRAGHRASVKRILSKAEDLLARPDRDQAALSQLKLSLKDKLDVLGQLDNDILELIDAEDALTEDIEQADIVKEGIYGVIVKLESASSAPPDPAVPKRVVVPPTADKVKLPKLTIQRFNGELTTWMTFWDSFKSAVHDNPSLTDMDKFNYLRSYLERSALEAVSGLTLTSANYREAIDILQKRYGDKQQIISRHMDVLLNVEPVTSQHNVKALRHLYDLLESQMRSLRSLGVTSDSYGNLLSSVLLNKLPSELRLVVSRGIGDRWDLNGFMKTVEEEIRARERVVSSNPPKKPDREHPTAATLFSGSQNSVSCCYCYKGHPSSSCRNVPQVETRTRMLMKAGRCFVCLRRGHISRDCRFGQKCSNCGGRHHVSICSRGTSAKNSAAGQQSRPFASSSSNLNPEAPAYSGPASQPASSTSSQGPPAVSLCVGTDKSILLQTASVSVFNPNAPQTSLRVRVILDSGSQWSYVTSQVKDQLNLESDGEQRMSIMTFGSSEGKSRNCERVKVGLNLKNGKTKQFSMFVVPLICQPLTCQPVDLCKERFEHLAGLELADSSDGSSHVEVNMLVGSDQYWELMTGQTCRGPDGPVAVSAELGWVLSGPAVSSCDQSFSNLTMITHTLRVDGLTREVEEPLDELLQSF